MNKNLVIGIVIVTLLLIGGFLFMSNNATEDTSPQNNDSVNLNETDNTMEDDSTMMEEDSMMDDDTTSGDAMGDEDDNENADAVAVEIEITGGNYAFDPDTFTVQAGQEVTVTLTSNDMMHDFVLEGLDIQTEIIEAGDTGSVTFTAPEEPGEYTYYCSVGNHRAMGMVGTMIVE